VRNTILGGTKEIGVSLTPNVSRGYMVATPHFIQTSGTSI